MKQQINPYALSGFVDENYDVSYSSFTNYNSAHDISSNEIFKYGSLAELIKSLTQLLVDENNEESSRPLY
jgi:hypothetical protein